ncbi:MAG: hypothetical protein IJK57_07150 [Ruminococcus sp.]|nr:hypothetical protein [Ruminococcus sp.]MBR3666812.1 hypothetical protein [Ruminococcus sp.]MBR6996268.1 hypothetical protein [Ruminococcus sp.]
MIDMSEFVSADIEKFVEFETQAQEAIEEFQSIKDTFDDINSTLLSKWQGAGKDAYEQESSHIMENVTGIETILNTICDSVIKDVKDAYLQLDEELGAFNQNPSGGEQ